jgi:hypothetical protein
MAGQFKWQLLGTVPLCTLYDVPSGSIKTPSGTELPAHVLIVWDDASLLAVGIRRTVIDDDG